MPKPTNPQQEIALLRAKLSLLEAEICNAAVVPQKPRASQTPQHRFTLRVPHTDLSTIQWWHTQDDPSASVRTLVRNDVAVNGLSDPTTRTITARLSAPVFIINESTGTVRQVMHARDLNPHNPIESKILDSVLRG
ncbi:MAG TPA: hypothetical protein VFU07_05425 [Candidatus Lumbricidophila sp.]|nr:hypothetical protein [Candidatus Lumbricidophila sp.]